MEAFRIIQLKEKDFDGLIESLGGSRFNQNETDIDELNADYILDDSIIELKIVEEEPLGKSIKQQKLADLFNTDTETVVIDHKQLNKVERFKYYDIFNNPIKSHVKKASKQLKSTQNLIDFQAIRILLIINNGIYSLFPEEFQEIVLRRVQNDTSNIDIVLIGGIYFYGDDIEAKIIMPMQEYYINGSFNCNAIKIFLNGWGEFCNKYMTNNVKDIKEKREKGAASDIIFEHDDKIFIKPLPYLGKSNFFPSDRPREDSTGQEFCPIIATVLPDFSETGWEIAKERIFDAEKLKYSLSEYKNWVFQQKENRKDAFKPIVDYLLTEKECSNKESFCGLCATATEKFNNETDRIIFERTFEFSESRIALSYILLYIIEVGVDKANDYASIYYVSELPGFERKKSIIKGKRMKYEFGISLASVYAVLYNVPCIYYIRNQKYMWK